MMEHALRACFRRFVAVLGVLLLVPTVAFALPDRPTVVELFTSQGCSACPPADAYLSELANREDVLALSLPVTYWDYLGWVDTLAKHDYDLRQRGYARRSGSSRVYTPQMVIDGVHREIGSHRQTVDAVIAYQQEVRAAAVTVDLRTDDDAILVTIGEDKLPEGARSATVWLLQIDNKVAVDIDGGENRGRTPDYVNVVRELSPVGMWDGTKIQISLPTEEMLRAGRSACAILVQIEGNGEIIGAAKLDLTALLN